MRVVQRFLILLTRNLNWEVGRRDRELANRRDGEFQELEGRGRQPPGLAEQHRPDLQVRDRKDPCWAAPLPWHRWEPYWSRRAAACGRAQLLANFFGGAVWGVFRENANCGDPGG